jgi:16S rRNA (guanine966-N2)-methyltransferase
MRIVAGRFRGRVLAAPDGATTRPTSDRARESLFNILAHGEKGLVGARVLDVFAGSGAVGLEALSRGASHATFIDNDVAAQRVLAANIRKLGVEPASLVLKIDAARPPNATLPCHFVFLDPPYFSGLAGPALTALAAKGWLAAEAVVVVEIAAAEDFVSPLPGWECADERRYGAAKLVFLRPHRRDEIVLTLDPHQE